MRINRIIKYGVSYLSLNCSRAVIEEMIDKYIDKCKECFSFQEICRNIKHIAEGKGYFEKEENTEYANCSLANLAQLKKDYSIQYKQNFE